MVICSNQNIALPLQFYYRSQTINYKTICHNGRASSGKI